MSGAAYTKFVDGLVAPTLDRWRAYVEVCRWVVEIARNDIESLANASVILPGIVGLIESRAAEITADKSVVDFAASKAAFEEGVSLGVAAVEFLARSEGASLAELKFVKSAMKNPPHRVLSLREARDEMSGGPHRRAEAERVAQAKAKKRAHWEQSARAEAVARRSGTAPHADEDGS